MRNDQQGAPYRVRDVLKQFDQRGIAVGDGVNTAVAVLDRIEDAPRTQSEHPAIREAILADADGDEIEALLLQELGFERLRSEHARARITAAVRVLSAILRARDELHPQLRELADDAIANLNVVAGIGSASLDTLVRDRRVKEAQALAEVGIVAAELDALYSLRDRFLVPGGVQALSVGHVNASRWRDPIVAEHHASGRTLAEQYISGLRAGVELWSSTPEEAVEVAQPIYAKLQRKAEEI